MKILLLFVYERVDFVCGVFGSFIHLGLFALTLFVAKFYLGFVILIDWLP